MTNHRSRVNFHPVAMATLWGLLLASVGSVRAEYPLSVSPQNFHPGYYLLIKHGDNIRELDNPDFVGVKIKYEWSELHKGPGRYDFGPIEKDMAELRKHGKQLWFFLDTIQWRQGSDPYVPEFLRPDGVFQRQAGNGGWYPDWTDPATLSAVKQFYAALGARYGDDPNFEGLSNHETAYRVQDGGFSCDDYLAARKEIDLAIKAAFPRRSVMSMINNACFDVVEYGEWLVTKGIGIGTPDSYAIPEKDHYVTNAYAPMKKHGSKVPMGPDFQWPNFDRNTDAGYSLADMRDFIIAKANPWYMFWRTREPYFSEQSGSVVDVVRQRKLPAAESFYNEGVTADSDTPRPPVLIP